MPVSFAAYIPLVLVAAGLVGAAVALVIASRRARPGEQTTGPARSRRTTRSLR